MMEQTIYVRDVEAVRRLLDRPPTGWYWTPASSDNLEHQLALATTLAQQNRRTTALMVEAGPPVETYMVVRLIDMPLLAVAVYDRLVGENGKLP